MGVEDVVGAAKKPAGAATKGQFVAAPVQARAQADHAVERRVQDLDGLRPPPWLVRALTARSWFAATKAKACLPGSPGTRPGRPQSRRVAPANRVPREAVVGEGLGEGLARVLEVVAALVPRIEATVAPALETFSRLAQRSVPQSTALPNGDGR